MSPALRAPAQRRALSSTEQARQALQARIVAALALDLRSLAALRIGVALLIVANVLYDWGDGRTFWTDAGILPRDLARSLAPSPWLFSLNFLDGGWALQAALLALQVAAALCLLIGFAGRAASIASWLLLLSLQNRNLAILTGGDLLLLTLLFWGMFLPWAERWSCDAARRPRPARQTDRVFNGATLAYAAQIMILYEFSALQKLDPAWRSEYTAVYYALSIHWWSTPFARWLLPFSEVLRALTFAIWWFELLGPWLLFLPFWTARLRLATVAGFVALPTWPSGSSR